jgi:DNA-binding response OmpR family regulator
MDYNNFLEVIYKISKEIFTEKNSTKILKEPTIKLNDDLFWDNELKQLYFNNKLFKLTKKEFLLLKLLTKIPEKIYVNEEIISYVWEEDEDNADISNLKNLISRLRSKLPILKIENIYGFGYKLIIQ